MPDPKPGALPLGDAPINNFSEILETTSRTFFHARRYFSRNSVTQTSPVVFLFKTLMLFACFFFSKIGKTPAQLPDIKARFCSATKKFLLRPRRFRLNFKNHLLPKNHFSNSDCRGKQCINVIAANFENTFFEPLFVKSGAFRRANARSSRDINFRSDD